MMDRDVEVVDKYFFHRSFWDGADLRALDVIAIAIRARATAASSSHATPRVNLRK